MCFMRLSEQCGVAQPDGVKSPSPKLLSGHPVECQSGF